MHHLELSHTTARSWMAKEYCSFAKYNYISWLKRWYSIEIWQYIWYTSLLNLSKPCELIRESSLWHGDSSILLLFCVSVIMLLVILFYFMAYCVSVIMFCIVQETSFCKWFLFSVCINSFLSCCLKFAGAKSYEKK
jgi:hypothetical protein